MTRLAGKVAVVTGAKLEPDGVGIGGAVARKLVAEGARVALVNRTYETAQALADELDNSAGAGTAIAVQTDLFRPDEIQRAVDIALETFGRIDILVNNAAVTGTHQREKDALDVSVELWDSIYALNVRAPFLMMKAALPGMIRRGGGSIVNVSSTASLSGEFIRTAYGSSKAALNVLSQYIATQYGRSGVRCNAVVPGLTVTANTRRNIPPETWAVLERQVTRPVPNSAEDVANAIAFLVSDEGAGINGDIIRVDGGFAGHAPYAMDLHDLMSATGGLDRSVGDV